VRATLIAKYAADPARIDAQGAGYLSPRTTNETPEGRTMNRRVEVMLTPTP
jgi:OOP family OmpA-OmpF porin